MSCTHKFYRHSAHMDGANALLPKWKIKTLIIGTFNPENTWHDENTAKYYYGRSANYFWDILPFFAEKTNISKEDVASQLNFLKTTEIGLTDILISVNDADIKNETHRARIKSVKDKELEQFESFTWNSDNIVNYINANNITSVYFTYLGDWKRKKPKPNTFEEQTRKIEEACNLKGIKSFRLHTPSGQGLGKGSPRENVLIDRWYSQNGANLFPFLSKNFNLSNFPIHYSDKLSPEEFAKYFK